jgi:hypothetical protein
VLDRVKNSITLNFASDDLLAFASAGEFDDDTRSAKCLAEFVGIDRNVDEFGACTINNGWNETGATKATGSTLAEVAAQLCCDLNL